MPALTTALLSASREERDRGSVAQPGALPRQVRTPVPLFSCNLSPDEMWTLAVADNRERERGKDERR
jgi:hypothetical protein